MRIYLKLKTSTSITLKIFKQYILFLFRKNYLANLSLAITLLPINVKKFTFLKAPCIHKTALTQWELRTYQACYTISNFSASEYTKLKHIITFFSKNLPPLLKLTVLLTKRIFI